MLGSGTRDCCYRNCTLNRATWRKHTITTVMFHSLAVRQPKLSLFSLEQVLLLLQIFTRLRQTHEECSVFDRNVQYMTT